MKNPLILLILLALALFSPHSGAVEYQLPDTDGNIQSLDQYQGKWVVVNYWATWCSTCQQELPELIDLHTHGQQKQIVVVGINFESIDLVSLKRFIEKQEINFPILRSHPIPITPLGRVPALPTTYLINPNGEIVAGEVGLITRKNIEDYIAQQTEQKQEASRTDS